MREIKMSINNINRFKEKIQRGELCVGTSITFTDPAISELLGDAGYDFTWIDMEHCPIDINTALQHVMAVRGTHAAPFIRVLSGDPITIKPILELHPAAVIIPQIQTEEDVTQAVAACKYPPTGQRGFGARRGRKFGGIPYPEYLKNADDQIMVIVQIEHINAVKVLDDILAVSGLDGLCLGFNDLAGSMGLSGQVTHPQVIATADEVINKTRQTDKSIGIAMGYDLTTVKPWIDKGIHWISIGSDFNNFYVYSKQVLEALRTMR